MIYSTRLVRVNELLMKIDLRTWAGIGVADSCFKAVSHAGSTAILSRIPKPDPLLGAATTSLGAGFPGAPGIPGAVD